VATKKRPSRRNKKDGGRPTKLTKEIATAIYGELRSGSPIDMTADLVGVPRATLREWVRRGEGNDERPAAEPYIGFAKGYRQARATGEKALRHVVLQAAQRVRPVRDEHGRQAKDADGQPLVEGFNPNAEQLRATMWLLSRGWPEHWGQQRENVSIAIDIPERDDDDGASDAGGGVQINVILAADDDTP
jgi:hypothetical protein